MNKSIILTGLYCKICGCQLEGQLNVAGGLTTVSDLKHSWHDALRAPITEEYCEGREEVLIEASRPTEGAA